MNKATSPTPDASHGDRRGWQTGLIMRLLALYPAIVAALLVLLAVLGPRGGPAALAAILSMHITLSALPLIFVAWRRDARWLRLALAALLVVAGFRFGDEWLSLPVASDGSRGTPIRLVSWNLEVGRSGASTVEDLLELEADVVALQELHPGVVDAIEADATLTERYPYRVFMPDYSVLGNGLMSRFPIESSSGIEVPPGIEARLDIAGTSLSIINAHPMPGEIELAAGLGVPVAFDPRIREEHLRALRTRVDEMLASGEPFVLIGDFNTAPTEASYADLAAGMRDVHTAVGTGPGWTWRPSRFEGLGIGLLRIDQAHAGPGVVPLASHVDCPVLGDHCRLLVTVALAKP